MNVYADGGCFNHRFKEHRQAYGSYKIDYQEPVRFELGNKTSNEAEYLALIKALRECRSQECLNITIYTDSQLLVGQLTKNWKCNATHLIELRNQARNLIKSTKADLKKIDRLKMIEVLGH